MSRCLARVVLVVVIGVMALPLLALAQVPRDAYRYRSELTRNARMIWGIDAPVAAFAAQIHQESGWRRDARSPYAYGLAQFTPATADWIGGIDPELASNEPGNPVWALRALVRYDRWLWDRLPATAAPCDRMALALAGYNGGAGWIDRDRRQAKAAGADPDRWWGQVERYNAGRNAAAFAENRGYPRIILLKYEPAYLLAGFGLGACA